MFSNVFLILNIAANVFKRFPTPKNDFQRSFAENNVFQPTSVRFSPLNLKNQVMWTVPSYSTSYHVHF